MENISPSSLSQRNGLEPRKDDFWEALSSNYYYLMNDELIATCREASGELDMDEEARVSPPRETLSYAEFVRQFNLLHDWLHQLQSSLLDSADEHKAKVAEVALIETYQVHHAAIKAFQLKWRALLSEALKQLSSVFASPVVVTVQDNEQRSRATGL
ncbi:hypothetical protein V5799_011913 [Amblyomma americanum]|uniref:Uncharacterized protein n=1 Tax=Amblyomma americanum TaxID=6943 RepID=A0AAQ4EFV9_AMBAM